VRVDAVLRNKKPTRLTPFYGYPAEILVEWCCISLGTALKLKNGQRKATKPVMRLFELHRDGRVLDDAWSGFRCVRGELWGPDGRSFSPSHAGHVTLLAHALSESNNARYQEWLAEIATEEILVKLKTA
jgi:hypothetical protein